MLIIKSLNNRNSISKKLLLKIRRTFMQRFTLIRKDEKSVSGPVGLGKNNKSKDLVVIGIGACSASDRFYSFSDATIHFGPGLFARLIADALV